MGSPAGAMWSFKGINTMTFTNGKDILRYTHNCITNMDRRVSLAGESCHLSGIITVIFKKGESYF